MNISASELVKRSVSQLVYKELKWLKWKATPRQHEGNAHAEEIVKKESASSEKRGIVPVGDDLLFFCIDMVKGRVFTEIKMVDDPDNYEEWYLQQSIMQSTFYASLLKEVSTLDTPLFKKKEGYKQEVIIVPPEWDFQLLFGEKKYAIYPDSRIKDHYFNKIKVLKDGVVNRSFDEARLFDAEFKHKEFELFLPEYKEISRSPKTEKHKQMA